MASSCDSRNAVSEGPEKARLIKRLTEIFVAIDDPRAVTPAPKHLNQLPYLGYRRGNAMRKV